MAWQPSCAWISGAEPLRPDTVALPPAKRMLVGASAQPSPERVNTAAWLSTSGSRSTRPLPVNRIVSGETSARVENAKAAPRRPAKAARTCPAVDQPGVGGEPRQLDRAEGQAARIDAALQRRLVVGEDDDPVGAAGVDRKGAGEAGVGRGEVRVDPLRLTGRREIERPAERPVGGRQAAAEPARVRAQVAAGMGAARVESGDRRSRSAHCAEAGSGRADVNGPSREPPLAR